MANNQYSARMPGHQPMPWVIQMNTGIPHTFLRAYDYSTRKMLPDPHMDMAARFISKAAAADFARIFMGGNVYPIVLAF
jgi:hypothetical protein